MVKNTGRVRYPDYFKKKVFAETFVKGASIAGVARRHDLNANMVFGWRKDERFLPKDTQPVFLPVEVNASDVVVTDQPTEQSSSPIVADIELAGGHRLSFKDGIDPDVLLTFVRGLIA